MKKLILFILLLPTLYFAQNTTVRRAELQDTASAIRSTVSINSDTLTTLRVDINTNTNTNSTQNDTLSVLRVGINSNTANILSNLNRIDGLSDSTGLNTIHRTSSGTDHTYINQDVTTTSNPTFVSPTVKTVGYDTTYTPTGSETTGTSYWDADKGTFTDVLNNGTKLQRGQELHYPYVKATEVITNGQLVQFAGVQGGHSLIKLCVPSEINNSPYAFMGVATQDFNTNDFGYVAWFGEVNDIYTKTPANGDTQDWLGGDTLYYSNTTGQLTNIKPTAPERTIVVAAVEQEQNGAAQDGKLLVRVSFGSRITDADDVNGTPLNSNGQILVWNNANQYFDATENINDYANVYDWSLPEGGVILDGVNDRFSHPDNANLNFGDGDFSIEWYGIFYSGYDNASFVSKKQFLAAVANGYALYTTASTVRLRLYDGTTDNQIYTTKTLTDGKKYHIFAIIDRTNSVASIYVNNELWASKDISALTGSIDNNRAFFINEGDLNNVFWKNITNRVNVFNYALSESDRKNLWNNGQPEKAVVPYEYRDASNTNIHTSFTNSDFNTYLNSGTGFSATAISSGENNFSLLNLELNKKYRFRYNLTLNSGALPSVAVATTSAILSTGSAFYVTSFEGENYIDFYPTTPVGYLGFKSNGAVDFSVSDVEITQLGEVASFKPNSVGANGWVCKVGGQLSVANSSGSPIPLSNEADGRQGVSTSEVILTNTQKANTRLVGITVIEKSGSANTYSIGTATGVYDIANAVAISANSTAYISINQLSLVDRNLYVKAGANSLIFILNYEEI